MKKKEQNVDGNDNELPNVNVQLSECEVEISKHLLTAIAHKDRHQLKFLKKKHALPLTSN